MKALVPLWMVFVVVVGTGGVLRVNAAEVIQPVVDFTITQPLPGEEGKAKPRMAVGHLADEIRWTGTARRLFTGDGLRFRPGQGESGGVVSLNGPMVEKVQTMNFANVRDFTGPRLPASAVQHLIVNARGRGIVSFAMLGSQGTALWEGKLDVNSATTEPMRVALDGEKVGHVKAIAFRAAPAAEVEIANISIAFDEPPLSPEERLFVLSLTKLRRSHDPQTGFVKDRAHVASNSFIGIPATGLHALAIAAASREGLFEPELAREEVKRAITSVLALSKANGLLPHFAEGRKDGTFRGTTWSEYSTVDTALAYQSLLLAADILDLKQDAARISAAIHAIEWNWMIDADGMVHHGYYPDGIKVLPAVYREWGGEAALVNLLEAMARGDRAVSKMAPTGRVYRGHGFIGEIQSLLYSDFDRPDKDLLSGVSWPDARRALMAEQSSYFKRFFPDSRAAKDDIWGLSAGETGTPRYGAFGWEDEGRRWIHPHYQVMAICQLEPEKIPAMVAAYEKAGLLHPMGLPEGFDCDYERVNPMNGSLNASFETLAAYHGWKRRGENNAIDRASAKDPLIRMAMLRFYPEARVEAVQHAEPASNSNATPSGNSEVGQRGWQLRFHAARENFLSPSAAGSVANFLAGFTLR